MEQNETGEELGVGSGAASAWHARGPRSQALRQDDMQVADEMAASAGPGLLLPVPSPLKPKPLKIV